MPDRRSQKYGFAQRHTLAFTGDGFLFPKLTMTPSVDGKQKLQWTRWQPDHARIEFMTSGEANVDRNPLEAELKRVIEAVLERIKDLGCQQGSVVSDLEDSWQAIKNLDPEEHDFCRAAALLGIDPFHVGEEKAETIIKFWERTNPFIREDVLASLEEDSFLDASPWLEDIQTQFEHNYKGSRKEWAAIRNSLPKMRLRKPWEQGYMLARCLRHKLDCGDGSFDFASSRQPTLSFWTTETPSDRLEGFVSANEPACAIVRKGDFGERFLRARALGDYMGRSEIGPGILTSMDTARQAQSRAFAAELLAPYDSLCSRLADYRETGDEVINALSQEFKVSDLLIRYQIKNHELTRS